MHTIATQPRPNHRTPHPFYTAQGLIDPASLRPVEAFEVAMAEEVPERDWTPLLSLVIALLSCVGCAVILLWMVTK